MSHILIIRGYSGCGKSTVSKYLASKYGYACLEYDDFLFGMNGCKKCGRFEHEIAFKNFLMVLSNYLKSNKNVIIDGPFFAISKFDPLDFEKVLKKIKKSKTKFNMVQLVSNEQVQLKRMRKRNHVVPVWARRAIKKGVDSTRLEYEEIIDTSELSIRQVINRIVKNHIKIDKK
ncbi:MAG: AAA family ATPase [Nanoarchaeota archaeon]|nr:AAA family ATPase [Nanoarchaeota archaeon]